jgi:hypothetical protein
MADLLLLELACDLIKYAYRDYIDEVTPGLGHD